MIFGYLIVISKNDQVDYLKLAYALALSIKNTQREGFDKVALITDDVQSVKKLKSPNLAFNKVIKWDKEKHWDGRSYMDKLSPWDYTVCLDADMLFLRDCSHWIEYFIENTELYVPNKAYTYRNEIISNDYYRRCFTKNELPNLYSFFTFFKKDSKLAEEFFSLGRYIIKNPVEFKNLFLSKHKPKVVGTDEAFALAAKILDIKDEISFDLEFPRVVHLKPMVQDWPWPANKVSDHVGFYLNTNGFLKLGNHQQSDVIHYNEKELVTDEVVSILEEYAWKK
jgi:hypothetical protein